jgi:hypothetical protein
MKKLSLVLAAVVLSASISFAQEKTAPATGKTAATNNTDKGGKSTKSTKTTKAETKPAPKAADKK